MRGLREQRAEALPELPAGVRERAVPLAWLPGRGVLPEPPVLGQRAAKPVLGALRAVPTVPLVLMAGA